MFRSDASTEGFPDEGPRQSYLGTDASDGAAIAIEYAGHPAMAERPAEYNRLLRLFIDVVQNDRDLEILTSNAHPR